MSTKQLTGKKIILNCRPMAVLALSCDFLHFFKEFVADYTRDTVRDAYIFVNVDRRDQ